VQTFGAWTDAKFVGKAFDDDALCRGQVQSEAALLAAVVSYAAHQHRGPQHGEALQQLLPCVRFPLLGLSALVNSVEADLELMALPCTKAGRPQRQCRRPCLSYVAT